MKNKTLVLLTGLVCLSLGAIFYLSTVAYTHLLTWGGPGSAPEQFANPQAMAVDAFGNIYVSDTNNNRIKKYSPDGALITSWGSRGRGDGQFRSPRGIALDSEGNLYVADRNNNRIQKFTSDGVFIEAWGSRGTADGQFVAPQGIAIDTRNPAENFIFVAEGGNNRVQKFSTSGRLLAPTTTTTALPEAPVTPLFVSTTTSVPLTDEPVTAPRSEGPTTTKLELPAAPPPTGFGVEATTTTTVPRVEAPSTTTRTLPEAEVRQTTTNPTLGAPGSILSPVTTTTVPTVSPGEQEFLYQSAPSTVHALEETKQEILYKSQPTTTGLQPVENKAIKTFSVPTTTKGIFKQRATTTTLPKYKQLSR